jgi:hypothetical protein
MQEESDNALERPVSFRVNQIFAEQLDPLIPPTRTPTPTITSSPTPGPSPTATFTPTATATFIPTATATASPTSTPLPTLTPTFTPEPQQANAVVNGLPKMQIYQFPGGPVIGQLRAGQRIQILYREETLRGLVWVEIQDGDGRIGWVPLIYLQYLTPTPMAGLTLEPSQTATPTPTLP